MKKRYTISFIILICALIGLFLWNVGVGTVELSLSDLPEIFGKGSDSTLYQVIWKIRLPRIVAAILLGGAYRYPDFCCRVSSRIRSQVRMCLEFLPAQNWWWH